MSIEDMACNVTVSVGVASWTDKYERIEDWVKAADDALYAAKNNGRNMVVIAPRKKKNQLVAHPPSNAKFIEENLSPSI
jgi:predicted signal transduction protein with EAL and GGDEF domain